jgi:L-serine/L-threonine ammonia-lyase
MVPAYDDKVVWDGHASMITEIHEQLGAKPDAIVCSVGGGGLLGGVIAGCESVGWDDGPYALSLGLIVLLNEDVS